MGVKLFELWCSAYCNGFYRANFIIGSISEQKIISNLFILLLVGIILGTLLGSFVTFLQVLIDPVEYIACKHSLQVSLMQAEFCNVGELPCLVVAFLFTAIVLCIS
ncbi:hypothetical protein [Lentibacillus sp. CBA3610]|uniref:hypothetical protein n=1 Tax=Lentibacillus sp. CBA3610 TaxID=2518176 RepID=UPI00350E4D0A